MTRVTLEEKMAVACPKCGAPVGHDCASESRNPFLYCEPTKRPHPERREAYLRDKQHYANALARGAWKHENPGVCPCESHLDDPGEHIDTCRWNDPNYDEGGPF